MPKPVGHYRRQSILLWEWEHWDEHGTRSYGTECLRSTAKRRARHGERPWKDA